MGRGRRLLLYAISRLFEEDGAAHEILSSPEALLKDGERLARFLDAIRTVAARYCVDLREEFVAAAEAPDYKSVLKSPTQVQEMESRFRKSYMYDVARDREKLPSADFA